MITVIVHRPVSFERHWSMDDHRYHADPRAVYFVRMFSAISYDKISGIHLKEETKQALPVFVKWF